ncbi:MAG: RNHCP domain-containing protein [Candidatus Buchananbacteria bacterium]|nr:RNHCP domain-containing protein [Candidatus Buchananbacteria bacterium]
MAKRFTKKKENFICEHCSWAVSGTGYTNHCPKCLWSKHVDINPGDRDEECSGLMKPVDLYKEGQNWVLVHQCERCDIKKRNRISEDDDFDEVIRLSQEIADKKMKK